MKLHLTLAALAATAFAANAATIASTSFETADNFAAGNNQSAGYTVTAADGATWTAGPATNYAGTWTGQSLTGTQSTVIGNAGHFFTVDAAGTDGVTSIDFSWERYTTTAGNLLVQWTTDAIAGATWTTAETINLSGTAGGGWAAESVAINQTGDVKVRFLLEAGTTGGASFDDVSVDFTAVPEPSSTVLLGLGGLALILRRRK